MLTPWTRKKLNKTLLLSWTAVLSACNNATQTSGDFNTSALQKINSSSPVNQALSSPAAKAAAEQPGSTITTTQAVPEDNNTSTNTAISTPVQSTAGVTAVWSIAQSSSLLRFTIAKSLLGSGTTFSVSNSTTSLPLLTATIGESASTDVGFTLTAGSSGTTEVLTIDPGDPLMSSNFVEGINSLVLVVQSTDATATDDFDVSIDDFGLFSVGYTYFPDGSSTEVTSTGSFSGWSSYLAKTTAADTTTATSSTHYLNTSFHDILYETQE